MPKTKKAAPIKHFVVSEAEGPFMTTTPDAGEVTSAFADWCERQTPTT